MKKEPMVVVSVPYKNNTKMININVGDRIELTFRKDGEMVEGFEDMKDEGEYITKEFTVSGVIADKDFPTTDDWYSAYGFGIDIVASENIFKNVSEFENYRLLNVDKKQSANDAKVEKEITSITNKKEGVTVRNLVAQKERMMNYSKTSQTFSYVIIAILFLISIFNIINNISYSLFSRINEFGILRAIGLSNKGFRHLVILEGVMYGVISSICSLVLGFIIQYNLYKVDSACVENPSFNIPIKVYILVICINLLIGILSTYVTSKKIKDKSIVSSINSTE
jgi:putative ABC transport system permease protein